MRRMIVTFGAMIAGLWAGNFAADGHEYKVKELTVGHPWARATAHGVRNGVVYVTLVNDSKTDDKLLNVRSPVASEVSLHNNIKDGDIVRMREIKDLALPAGKITELKPGGIHIMLMGLKQPLKDGDMFPMTLTLANEGVVEIEVTVVSQD